MANFNNVENFAANEAAVEVSAATETTETTAAAASEGNKETSPRASMPAWMKKAMKEDRRIAFKGSNIGIKIGTLYKNSLSLKKMLDIVKRYQKKLTREQIEFSKSPTPAMLREKFKCIAFAKSEDDVKIDRDFAIILYNNGWIEYRSTDHYTTLKLKDCSTFTYQHNLMIDDVDETVLDETLLEKTNWTVCACLAGEEKITRSLIRHGNAVKNGTSDSPEGENDIDDDGEFEAYKRRREEPISIVRIPTPENRVLAQERRAEMQKIISRGQSVLTNRQAELYKLHFEYDIPLSCVAEMLKITRGACTHRLSGIQQRFSEQIKAITGEDVEKYLNLDSKGIKAAEGVEEVTEATKAENFKNISADDLDEEY